MSDPRHDAPWSIKAIAATDRAAAIAAAKRHNKTVGAWLGEAIRAYIAAERREHFGTILEPGAEDRLAVIPAVIPPLSLADWSHALRVAEQLKALNGKQLSPRSRVAVAARRALAAHLK